MEKYDANHADKIAQTLLKSGAIKINVSRSFEWASGIKSPVYFDNNEINANVAVRDEVVCAFVDFITEKFKDVDVIAGVASGGIPLGILIADRLKLPFIYVRSEAKKHGLKQQVEGSFKKGDKVILVEDYIFTGERCIKAINGIRDSELALICLMSTMNYGIDAVKKQFENEGVRCENICNLEIVLRNAHKIGFINKEEEDQILKFLSNPDNFIQSKIQ